MAFVKCPDCNDNVSTKALSCPNCGRPRPPQGWTARQTSKAPSKASSIDRMIEAITMIEATVQDGFSRTTRNVLTAVQTNKRSFVGWIVAGVIAVIVLNGIIRLRSLSNDTGAAPATSELVSAPSGSGASSPPAQPTSPLDYPEAALQDLESKTKQAFTTYAELKSESVKIVNDNRATTASLLSRARSEFIASTVQPWYDKESEARYEWNHPIDGLTVARSDGGYYEGPRADRAKLLSDVEATLTVGINLLYGAVSSTVVSCNTGGNALNFKAADLQEQLAKAKYAGRETREINEQADEAFNEQMNGLSRPSLCR